MANEMRDRLVELIYEARKEWDVYFNDCLLKGEPRSKSLNGFIADHLIENGVVVPQWISVKDRLPEEHDKYLCAEYSKMFNQYFIRTLYFAKDLYRHDRFAFPDKKGIGGFYESSGEWGMVLIDEVTHWMPLPEPPQKEGADNG